MCGQPALLLLNEAHLPGAEGRAALLPQVLPPGGSLPRPDSAITPANMPGLPAVLRFLAA